MKSFLWMVSGVCAAAAGFLVLGRIRTQQGLASAAPVEQLAHQLEDAWADHHTVA